MNSKENILSTLSHNNPDKIPIDFGATPVTGIHAYAVAELRNYFGLEKRLVKVHEPYQMLGLVEDDLAEAMGVDTIGVPPPSTMFGFRNTNWKKWTTPHGKEVLVSEHFNTTLDEDNNVLIYPKGDLTVAPSAKMPKTSIFFDAIIRQPPIVESELDPKDNLEEFDKISEDDLEYYRTETELAKNSGRAVVVTLPGTALGDIALVPAPFLKNPKGIRDVSEWYMSTITRPDYIHQIFKKQTEIALENLEKLWDAIGSKADVVFICGTDFGSQTSTFCASETFESLYMPYYKEINNWIHKHTSWKTFKHSCGAIESFIPLFIESGFDILNPIQISATGMDPVHLKKEYGKDIVFWGGGIDTQNVLPYGTLEDIRKQVLTQCEILGRDGGFVFNTVHNIQGDVPIENIIAMLKAIKEFNGESL